jgi:hypothetical protein
MLRISGCVSCVMCMCSTCKLTLTSIDNDTAIHVKKKNSKLYIAICKGDLSLNLNPHITNYKPILYKQQ